MKQNACSTILDLAEEKNMQEKTISYLTEQLHPFVEPGEAVLICAPDREQEMLSGLMERAVICCGGHPILWGKDRRWKNLLRLAFTSRATTIIGTPLVILGLSKLKKANATPLFIKNVVTVGYPCFEWMREGINRGFDCDSGECFALWDSCLVAGFSCRCSPGVHLRSEEYDLDIRDDEGKILPEGREGRWGLFPKGRPDLRYGSGGFGCLDLTPCPCGDKSPRIVNLKPVDVEDWEIAELAQYLHSWTSVLDCALKRGVYGLEIELVIFPGEKLPKLPTCARQIVRPWNPDVDEPIPFIPGRKNTFSFVDSH